VEGNILGIDEASNKAAVKATTGERFYFSLSEWKGAFPPQPGMKVDFDKSTSGDASNVYPLGKTPTTAKSNKPTKTKTAAILFALFLGGIGGHKFYMGSIGWGVLYLLFCWTYIPLILAIIETVRYVTMTDDEFQEKYAALDDGPFSFLW
jgi:TM2 domain-containing membrane protein YozV